MSAHQNDTKLVSVNAPIYGGYHPNTGGFGYTTAGHRLDNAGKNFGKKFGGKVTKQPAVDRPHMRTREMNVPDQQPKSVLEGVPVKMNANNPKVSMNVQKLPPVDGGDNQAGAGAVGKNVVL